MQKLFLIRKNSPHSFTRQTKRYFVKLIKDGDDIFARLPSRQNLSCLNPKLRGRLPNKKEDCYTFVIECGFILIHTLTIQGCYSVDVILV